MPEIRATDLERHEMNILQLYNKLATISRALPEYVEEKKGFDMCLLLFKKGLKDCPSVNHLEEIHHLRRVISSRNLKIKQLRHIINEYKKQTEKS